jgi:hypothetical protein
MHSIALLQALPNDRPTRLYLDSRDAPNVAHRGSRQKHFLDSIALEPTINIAVTSVPALCIIHQRRPLS